MNFNILTNDIEYTPWLIITKLTPTQELDEIKNIIDSKLISEIEDLYNECNILKEIHSEYRSETEKVYNKKPSESKDFNKLIHGSSFQISIFKDKIKFLINSLKEVQQINLKESILPKSTHNIVNYILKENEIQAQENYIEELKDKISLSTNIEKKSNSNQKFSFLSIDPIVNELRSHLLKEKNYLLKKIDLYHDLLDNEKLYREKIEDFSNQELPTLKAFQQASKELFENIQKEKEEYNINLIFSKNNNKKEIPPTEKMLTSKNHSNVKINSLNNQQLFGINDNQKTERNNENNHINSNIDVIDNSSVTAKVHRSKNKKEKDKANSKKTKLKKQKCKSISNSETLIRDKSIANLNEKKEMKNKHSKSKNFSKSPSTPILHRSPSKEYLPISSTSHIPLTLPLTSLVPSINLPFSPNPTISSNKVILNPIIPHPPLKPIKNDKIFSRKRYNVVPNSSSSLVTSSKLI